MSVRRRIVLALLAIYLPCKTGSAKFLEICKDFGGKGTTCGYLIAWIYWRLGCVAAVLVNRAEPSRGLSYGTGQNIAKPLAGAQAIGAWRTTGTPQPGDTLYWAIDVPIIRPDGSKDWREHVNVFVGEEGGSWRTADAGRTDPATGQQMAEYVTRRWDPHTRTCQFLEGPRRLRGFIDLDAVPLEGSPPMPLPGTDGGVGGLVAAVTVLLAVGLWAAWRS